MWYMGESVRAWLGDGGAKWVIWPQDGGNQTLRMPRLLIKHVFLFSLDTAPGNTKEEKCYEVFPYFQTLIGSTKSCQECKQIKL